MPYQLGFADKLKIMAARALGFDRPEPELIALMDEAKESWDIYVNTPEGVNWHDLSGREYLQHFGTQARRTFGEDFWVNMVLPDPRSVLQGGVEEQMEHQLEQMYPDVDVLIFTDLRFENEARRIKALGGTIWNVTRPGTESDGHASEQQLDPKLIDAYIVNDGTLTALDLKVDVLLAGLGL